MPPMTPGQLPALASSLIRLRGETLGRIANATLIRTANLSVWLRGREQVISAKRLVGLLHHLGLEGGHLRKDVLHQWRDRGGLDDSKAALTTLLANVQPVWLFQDAHPGFIKTRFLLAENTVIRVEIEPGVDRALDLIDVIKVDRIINTTEQLARVPTMLLESTHSALLELASHALPETGDEQSPKDLVFSATESIGGNLRSMPGWQRIESSLRHAMEAGMTPDDVASLLERHLDGK